jgi:hypothetical protein
MTVQNKYLEMMEATQRAISKANEISASAEQVTNMLGVHKDDLARMGEIITGRFNAIREMLVRDEKEMLEQIETLIKELDTAIKVMLGVPPPETTQPEAPSNTAPEVTHAET